MFGPLSTHMGRPRICAEPGCPQLNCPTHPRTAPPLNQDPTWPLVRAAALTREPNCRTCGKPATHIDHITPRRQGGTHHPDNLQALCTRCHNQKTNAGQ